MTPPMPTDRAALVQEAGTHPYSDELAAAALAAIRALALSAAFVRALTPK